MLTAHLADYVGMFAGDTTGETPAASLTLSTTLGKPRRAFSVCYMDSATQCRRKKRAPREFVRVW